MKRRKIVILLAVVIMGAMGLKAQAATRTLTATVDSITYHDIDHAGSNRVEHAARIRSLVGQVRAIEGQIADTRNRRARLQNEIAALQAEKARDMDEFRRGQYCTACHRTRTELRNMGVNPDQHFRENSQNGVAATPTAAEIAEREKGWDDKIVARQNELATLPSTTGLETDRLALTNKLINEEIPWWAGCVTAEILLRKQSWENEKADLQDKIAQTKKSLNDATTAYNRAAAQAKPNPAVLDGMKIGMDALRGQIQNLQNDLPLRRASHVKAMDTFAHSIFAEQKDLAGLCASIRNDMGIFGGNDIANKVLGFGWDFRLSFADANPLAGLSLTAPTGLSSTGHSLNDIKLLLEGDGTSNGFGLGAGSTPNMGLGADPKAVLEGSK